MIGSAKDGPLKAALKRLATWVIPPIGAGWRRLKSHMGLMTPRTLVAYRGWAGAGGVRLRGRVLANPPVQTPGPHARWWSNLRDTWRRWASDEIPDAIVAAQMGETVQVITCDDQGYFDARLPIRPEDVGFWRHADLELRGVLGHEAGAPEISGECPIMDPMPDARFGIISDIDDTVIETGITHLLTAIRLTFFSNARRRKPLKGVAPLYRALHTGAAETGGSPRNPIFYITSSAWNLHDLIDDFLRINDIPVGPIRMQALRIDRHQFIKSGHRHKLEKALGIVDDFPHLPFLLVGDSGQHDAALYAELAALRPEQIKAIVIRDVSPDRPELRPALVDEAQRRAARLGVPMWVVPDSAAAAAHLCDGGWISSSARAAIEAACGPSNPLQGAPS